jgi:hypothetical protein
MKVMGLGTGWQRAGAAAIGLGALIVTVGCGTRDLSGVSAQSITAGQTGLPVMVTCEPHQRTLVRPVVVNGATVSQVECVASGQVAPAPLPTTAAPAAPALAYQPVRAAQPAYEGLEDARVVPVSSAPTRVAQPVQTRQVVYEREPVKRTRSVKKSAIIIGSSAGVGAGVGAAVGGKKGALIGAAIGGGGAAIWDQITRRN